MELSKERVYIAGRSYTLSGETDSQRLHAIAGDVDRRMEEIMQRYPAMSLADAAILTAVNLSGENMTLQDEIERLNLSAQALQQENQRLRARKK